MEEEENLEPWQRILRDKCEDIVKRISWDIELLEECMAKSVITKQEYYELWNKKPAPMGYLILKCLRQKNKTAVEQFTNILLNKGDTEIATLLLRYLANYDEDSKDKIRNDIRLLVGKYLRSKRPSDKCVKELQIALVEHCNAVKNYRFNDLQKRATQRKNEGATYTEQSATKEENSPGDVKEDIPANSEKIYAETKACENKFHTIQDDMNVVRESKQILLEEQKTFQEDNSKLNAIENLLLSELQGVSKKLTEMEQRMQGNVTPQGDKNECLNYVAKKIKEIQNFEQEAKTKDIQLNKLLNSNVDKDVEIRDLKNKITSKENEMGIVQKQNHDLQAKLTLRQTEMQEFQSNIDRLNNEKYALEAKISHLEKEVQKDSEKIATLINEEKQSAAAAEDFELKHKAKIEEIDEANDKISSLQEQHRGLEWTVRSLTEEKRKLQANMQSIEAENENANVKIQELETTQKELKLENARRLDELEEEMKELEEDRDEMENTLSRVQEDNDGFHNENEKLQEEIAELKDEIRRLNFSRSNSKVLQHPRV